MRQMWGGASEASAVVVRSGSGVAAVVGRWWVGGGSVVGRWWVGSAAHIFFTFVGGSPWRGLRRWAIRHLRRSEAGGWAQRAGLFSVAGAAAASGSLAVRRGEDCAVGLFAICAARRLEGGRSVRVYSRLLGRRRHRRRLDGWGRFGSGLGLGRFGGGGIGGGWRADMISFGGWGAGVGSAAAASAAAGGLI